MLHAILVHITPTIIISPIQQNDAQLGLFYIAEYAKQNGFDVGVKHFMSTDPIILKIISLLHEHSANLLGFYVDSENIWTIRHIIYDIKKEIPDLIIAVGGPQVTASAQSVLKRLVYADFAIVGEGEIPFTVLLKNRQNIIVKKQRIPGIAYIDNNGDYVYGGDQQQYNNLDIYPFPRRKDYSLDENMDFIHISTGRGCIGRCTFCFEGSKTNNRLRLRSIECICAEIDYIIQNSTDKKYIIFLDDTFILNKERTTAICNHLIEKYNGQIKWYCEARVDILLRNKDLLPLMKKAGLCRIQLGGESGSDVVLNAYKKNMKTEQLKQVVRYIYNSGIESIYINFIIGGAMETQDTFNMTLTLAKELIDIAPCCAEVGCSLFSPYVGTPIYLDPDKFGIKIIDRELLAGQDANIPFVETTELNRYQIAKMRSTFDYDIETKYFDTITKSSYDELYRHYDLSRMGLSTLWHATCEKIPCLKNYFGAIINYGFSSIRFLSWEILQNSIPYRTNQMVSDGEKYYRERFIGDYQENSQLENMVLTLSSGKVSFSEIVTIIGNSYHNESSINIEQEIYNIFVRLDNEFLVIWKYLF